MFFATTNDHVCTRIEHVNLVASISKTICRTLGLNVELAEAISFGHDLGHSPFGHSGEKIIEELILENIELRKQIDKLEAKTNMQADVFDQRTLDNIIAGFKEEKQVQETISPFARKKKSGDNSDFMASYRKYRKISKEAVVDKDLKLDLSAYEKLAEWKRIKNA